MKTNIKPTSVIQRQRRNPLGDTFLELLPYLPTDVEASYQQGDNLTTGNVSVGTIIVTAKRGHLHYAIATRKTLDGNGFVFTCPAGTSRIMFDIYPNTFWWNTSKVLQKSAADAAARAVAAQAVLNAPVIVPQAPRETLDEALTKKVVDAEEVRHVATLPGGLVSDIAAIKGRMDGLSDGQTNLWADYLEHAERVEAALKENTAALKALLQSLGKMAS